MVSEYKPEVGQVYNFEIIWGEKRSSQKKILIQSFKLRGKLDFGFC